MKTLTYNRINTVRAGLNFIDYITLCSSPLDEDCTQVGESLNDMILECKALKDQIIRAYGPEPENTEFFILENHHDFGTYYELSFLYPDNEDEDTEESILIFEYLNKIQTIPELWDDLSIQFLIENDHGKYKTAKIIKLKFA
jgi:hypothetical protein